MENENYPKDTWINSHFGPHMDHSACSEISYKALHTWEVQFRSFLVLPVFHTISVSLTLDFSTHQCLDCSKGLSRQTNTRFYLPENSFFSPFY